MKDLMTLLVKRSEFMQKSCDERAGGMYAILGLQDDVVNQFCEDYQGPGIVMGANYNSPGQIVISGDLEAVDTVAALCQENGAKKVVKLNVAGAFHTPLMKGAAEEIREFARSLEFKPAHCPIFSNIDGQKIPHNIDFPEYLAQHMISPVRWTDEVQIIASGGSLSNSDRENLVGLIGA